MKSSPERFELSWGNPMYLAGTRLNHSAKVTHNFYGRIDYHNDRNKFFDNGIDRIHIVGVRIAITDMKY